MPRVKPSKSKTHQQEKDIEMEEVSLEEKEKEAKEEEDLEKAHLRIHISNPRLHKNIRQIE